MQAVKKIVHSVGTTISFTIPAAFRGLDIEVVAFPAQPRKKEARKEPMYDFSRWAGRLTWRGDAVAEQRNLRDEW